MSLPSVLADLLSEGAVPRAGGWYARGDCEGSDFHSPTPLVLRDIWLDAWSGHHDTDDRSVSLCGTCADNLSAFQDILGRFDGSPPWPVRRVFGNKIRALGEAGWAIYAAGRDGDV